MKLKYNLFSIIVLLLSITTVVSCQNEADIAEAKGGLRIMLNSISSSTLTRSTPSEIGKPVADKFDLRVVDNASGMTKYDGKMTNELIRLAGGEYTVTASCGENPIIATDAPYYIGTQEVTVVQNEVTETPLECKVGNALISVIFGANESDRTRFAKFYKSYGIHVKVDGYSVDIPGTASSMSAYFRAGSTPELEFYGVLAANDQQVNMVLTTPKEGILPNPFKAADHAIVTLTLPDPESATVLDISKVELTEATMEETIPLSWLPVPQAKPEHRYDANGDLIGTDITFSNCYPGMEWKAVVTDGNGTEYRSIEGTGEQVSTYVDNANGWPYVPAGKYTATYYLLQDGKEQKTGSREFMVNRPDLTITVDGYTSYDKYIEGDVEAANACKNTTIYGFQKHLSVSSALVTNTKYSKLYSIKTEIDGTTISAEGDEIANPDLSFDQHTLKVTGSFDGVTASAEKVLHITGLPYEADADKFNGWTGGRWSDNGDSGGAQAREPGESCYLFTGTIYTPKFHTPASIGFSMSWREWFYALTMRTSNYGLVASTSTSPTGNSTNPSNYTWTSVSFSGTLTSSTPYFGMTHQSAYTWGLNKFKVLYK